MRREAIDLTMRGSDATGAMNAPMMTMWFGQNSCDCAFQCDIPALWEDKSAGIAEVAAHDPHCMISIEFSQNNQDQTQPYPMAPRLC